MKTYQTDIEISAPPEDVWHALTSELPTDHKPFGILRFEGAIQKGARIKLWSEVSPDRAFALKVVTFDPPSRMVWRGGMPFGLFVGTRTFSITPSGAGSTFQMSEVFTGPLSGMITRSMPDLTDSFTKFAQALKQKAEAQ